MILIDLKIILYFYINKLFPTVIVKENHLSKQVKCKH